MHRPPLAVMFAFASTLAACSAENPAAQAPSRTVSGALDATSLAGLSHVVAIDTVSGAYTARVDASGAFSVEVPLGRSVVLYVLDDALTPVRAVVFDAGDGAQTRVLPVTAGLAGVATARPISLGEVSAVDGTTDEAHASGTPHDDVDSDDDGVSNYDDSNDDDDALDDSADSDDDGDDLDDDARFDAVARRHDDSDLDGVEDERDDDDSDGPGAHRHHGGEDDSDSREDRSGEDHADTDGADDDDGTEG